MRCNTVPRGVWVLMVCAASAAAAEPAQKEISIPLTVRQLPHVNTYKADVSIGFGNLRRLPIAFDTGSTGLHVFAAARLDAPGSGVECTAIPVSFTVGNPGRVTYSGVICNAVLHFLGFTTPTAVPVAYLTSASCTPNNPGCKLPNLNNPKAHGGVYGVFGAGITGPMPVPNPLLDISQSYRIELTRGGGRLVLADTAISDAAQFPLSSGMRTGVKWQMGQACLFVNGAATGSCLGISFDTGNGVPWIRDSDPAAIPQQNGIVTPGTQIGFAPPGAARAATTITAGTAFANRIKVQPTNKAPLTNSGIEAFFDHVVAYDNLNGRISISPKQDH